MGKIVSDYMSELATFKPQFDLIPFIQKFRAQIKKISWKNVYLLNVNITWLSLQSM